MHFSSKSVSNSVGRLRRFYGPVFFIVFSLVLLAITILGFASVGQYSDYPEVDARIINISDDQVVTVTYTVNGKGYDATLNAYSSSWNIGDTINVKYDPNDHTKVYQTGAGMFSIMLIVALAMLAIGVFRLIKIIKLPKVIEKTKNHIISTNPDPDFLLGFKPTLGEDNYNEYYFRFSGKANQGHLMETPEREKVYEAVLEKFNLLSKCPYMFNDYVNEVSHEHYIGKTTTSGGGNTLTDRSYFNFDGEDMYTLLHKNGYTIDTDILNKLMHAKYTLRYDGNVIGYINTSGTNILPNVKNNFVSSKLHSNGLFVIQCKRENVPILFLTALYIGRTEQYIYD